jgi:hypothetical protein
MRFLLVFISLIFSFIFLLFYTASLWKNIFFQQNDNFFFWKSLFWEMWISPLIFLWITVLLFVYFKAKLSNKEEKINNRPVHNIDFITYILSTILIYLVIWILLFIFNINLYFIIFAFTLGIWVYFIWKYLFYHRRVSKDIYVSLNIFSILSWYLASVLGLWYILFIQEDLLFLLILVFVWFFHVYIHVTYENIISLLFWVITFILSLYRLIVYLFPWII